VGVVNPETGYAVEEFFDAITMQLERHQDSLRLRSVTRPLLYAIRDFSMDLKVFVELSPDGRVMFRPSGAEEPGASVVHIGFTTVNRTMIEENTVSLSAVRSPSLDELGLDEDERRGLEKLGIRNAAQLDQLKKTTGETTVARYSGLPVSRLRQALAQGRPSVTQVRPVPARPVSARPVSEPSASGLPDGPTAPGPVVNGPVVNGPVMSGPVQPGAPLPGSPHSEPALRGPRRPQPDGVADDIAGGRVRVPARTRRLQLDGPHLEEAARGVALGGRSLDVRSTDGGIEVDLGDQPQAGTLDIDLGDAGTLSMSLEFDDDAGDHPGDPWRTP
jgi:hypothetical protein